MKVLAIGDIHQTENWKRFDFTKYDKVIFLGDYFDDFDSDWTKVNPIDNLREILELQKSNLSKVIVLIGNHDAQYIMGEEYSGKQKHKEIDIRNFLEDHLKEFRLCYQIKDYMFSHAGVSSIWCEDYQLKDIETINSLLQNRIYGSLCFYPYDVSWTGRNPHQSPIWIRPEALCKYPWKDYNQIVGHTSVNVPKGYYKFPMENGKDLWVVDNKEHTAYLELEI